MADGRWQMADGVGVLSAALDDARKLVTHRLPGGCVRSGCRGPLVIRPKATPFAQQCRDTAVGPSTECRFDWELCMSKRRIANLWSVRSLL